MWICSDRNDRRMTFVIRNSGKHSWLTGMGLSIFKEGTTSTQSGSIFSSQRAVSWSRSFSVSRKVSGSVSSYVAILRTTPNNPANDTYRFKLTQTHWSGSKNRSLGIFPDSLTGLRVHPLGVIHQPFCHKHRPTSSWGCQRGLFSIHHNCLLWWISFKNSVYWLDTHQNYHGRFHNPIKPGQ